MCGIAGALGPNDDILSSQVDALNRAQKRRGPDHTDKWNAPGIAVGNTRLAINDLSPEGNQPFISNDGRLVCVFNGEIYNSRELESSYCLNVSSGNDGAVIVPLWEKFGHRCLSMFRGMWAVAVVDRADSTLTLARDPFGIKPLSIRRLASASLAFASDARALASLAPKAPIDREGIEDFLQFGAAGPRSTMFSGVDAIPPNTWVRYRFGSAAVTETGRGPVLDGDRPLTEAEPGPGAWDCLLESVELHLRSDVPTALLLSAGVDSSLIACAASRRGHHLSCFTVQVSGRTDESGEAAKTAARFGHHHQVVRADLSAGDVDDFLRSMQRPTIDGLNTYLVSKAIAESGYKVALSGLGGDEAIAGYPHMRAYPLLAVVAAMDRLRISRPVARLVTRPKLARLVDPSGPREPESYDINFRELFSNEDLWGLADRNGIRPGRLGAPGKLLDLRSLIESEVTHYLQRTLLPDADAFSMSHSVELRVPFLDVPYFRAAATAARPFQGKRVLVAATRDSHVGSIARRRKRGFNLPMRQWMCDGPLRNAVAALDQPSAPIWDHLDRDRTNQLLADQPPERWAARWAFAALNGWLCSYRDQPSLAGRAKS